MISLFIFLLSVHKCCYITLYKILVLKMRFEFTSRRFPSALLCHLFNCKARSNKMNTTAIIKYVKMRNYWQWRSVTDPFCYTKEFLLNKPGDVLTRSTRLAF